jgi:ethylbenzene dehydrogenase/cytochrome b561-like protein
MKRRKTDYGTIILHWVLVAAIGVALLTGLRIATEAPDRTWINAIDFILPQASVWTLHIKAAIVLIGVSMAHAIYLTRSGLGRRVQLDKARLRALFGRRHARLGAVSGLLTWIFFGAMVALIISGGSLYFGVLVGYTASTVHWFAAWVVPAFACLHILVHFKIGGMSQLLRIFRPERLPTPPPRLDAVELLAMLAETRDLPGSSLHSEQSVGDEQRGSRGEARSGAGQPHPETRFKRGNVTLNANPLVVAAAIAITGASALVATDWLAVDSLQIRRIASDEAPTLDGDTSDPVWRNARPFSVMTRQGGNFDSRGESRVEIRAVHDGTWAYFLFVWEDPTRSLKQVPMIKKVDGWHVLHDGYERGDEGTFNEDKFSVLLTSSDADLAGDRTFHAGTRPVSDAPSTMTGRGLHFTAAGTLADVWQWKATCTTGWMDDDHFGPPLEPTPMQIRNAVPYRGGFAPDPGTGNYSENFEWRTDITETDPIVTPRRLPKDLSATLAAMGQITLGPDIGESDGARWFMTEDETTPYTEEVDRLIPVGIVLPGIIVSGEFAGDRADVRSAARWASGHWALEVARRLDTGSQYDLPIRTGIFMRVAAFDHSQIRHTRHVRPIRLEVE